MAIPENITKQHLLKAISKIDNEGIPKDGASQYYDVVYNGKKYPPKLIVSYANIFANGDVLDRNSFSGGLETQCFKLLQDNGFFIQKKLVSYYVVGAAWYGDKDNPDQSERFIENGIWENGYDDKLLDVVNSVNVGDRVAIKSSFATRDRKSFLRIKATGTVLKNFGDGRTLQVRWDNRFVPFDLEGYGGYRNTIQKVAKEDIGVIFKSDDRMSYYDELKKFLAQSETDELGTSNYLSNYQGLSVKISFGKGNQARVPWIAFLNNIDSVQQGIYPVYLYFKEKKLLILAYGVSETYLSERKWEINNGKTIEQFFTENNLGKPDRYGKSLVFKSYDIKKEINEEEINNDLNNLIKIYKEYGSKPKIDIKKKFQYQFFNEQAKNFGLTLNSKAGLRFISSLLTKPFVILTGLSGSGKTKLAQAFSLWICEDENQICLVPVGADWTNREPLLGFPNALEAGKYVRPDNRVLDLIIAADENPEKPYFLILDEMNLSHVERYFADFLSVMESSEKISLHTGNAKWNEIPSKVNLPKNLFIIGTVNIDETTYMFSPKVLDRASVIEFRVTVNEMKNYLESNLSLELDKIRSGGASMASDFLQIAEDSSIKSKESSTLHRILMIFFEELKKIGAEFGYRTAAEINRFAAVVNLIEPAWSIEEIIDAAIMQKLLPKVHGSRKRLAPVLETLGSLCMTEKPNDGERMEHFLNPSDEKDFSSRIKYPMSFEKIARMYRALLHNGFTSYAEA